MVPCVSRVGEGAQVGGGLSGRVRRRATGGGRVRTLCGGRVIRRVLPRRIFGVARRVGGGLTNGVATRRPKVRRRQMRARVC